METVITVLAVIAAVAVFALFARKKGPSDTQHLLLQQQLDGIRDQLRQSLEGSSQIVNKQLTDISAQLQTQLHRQTGTISDTRKAMDERLDNAARIIGDMQKTMGHVQESLEPVGEIRDILKAPKMRGGFGELLLENLLEEMLPNNMYSLQHGFADGERVDAAIKIGGQFVPIDSKFPLEKYRDYLKTPDEDEKKNAKKGLISAIKKHIADVSKYIRPDEGTYPFAFMYIPSEGIYYDLFISSDNNSNVWPYAANLRVFPVSSNTLYIYLQTISFGLKGMQIAEHARELLNKLEHLQKSFGDIRRNFEKIGTHLKNAQGAYKDTDDRLEKLESKFEALSTETPQMLAEPDLSKSDDASKQVQ
jgi:DNA recombination protein RmuC